MIIVDRYGRPVRGLGISLNPSYTCNFGCVFCHMEGVTTSQPSVYIQNYIYKIGIYRMRLD